MPTFTCSTLFKLDLILLPFLSKFGVQLTFADKLQLGRRSLYRHLKKVTGLTPAQYIRALRLELARGHLEKGTYKTMAEVAYASGFTTPYHFSKLYEKRFGRKPTSYLKS